MNNPVNTAHHGEELIDIPKLLDFYKRSWKWILLGLFICCFLAYGYLRYTDAVYLTFTKIRILDNEENNQILEITDFMSKSTINLDNEIANLTSIRLAEKVVDSLDLNITYRILGGFKTTTLYNPPFKIYLKDSTATIPENLKLEVIRTGNNYEVIYSEDDLSFSVQNGLKRDFQLLGLTFGFETFPEEAWDVDSDAHYEIVIQPLSDAAISLIGRIVVETEEEDSDILKLSMKSTDGAYAKKVLNSLITIYADDGVLDRQQVSRKTIDFIDNRLIALTGQLDSIENLKKRFKEDNQLIILEADAAQQSLSKTQKEGNLIDIETQQVLAIFLKEVLNGEEPLKLLPLNMGLSNDVINKKVDKYNTLLLDFKRFKSSAGLNNPSVKLLQAQLTDLKNNINSSVNVYLEQLSKSKKRAEAIQKEAANDYRMLPEKEQFLRKIEREQLLKENLYLLLLEKSEEASIELAVTEPNLKVIDYPFTSKIPVTPKRMEIILFAIAGGLSGPMGILLIVFLLDNKIYDRKDIEGRHLNIPLLGEIPLSSSKSIIPDEYDRSPLSEAFKILGSNINYKLGRSPDKKASIVLVTSSTQGEGKSFVSVNLSLGYTFLNKRVLLIGADLRNPQIHKYFDTDKNHQGLSDYLQSPNIDWKDCLQNPIPHAKKFHVITSGAIRSNPTLLLSNERFKVLIKSVVEDYDYVIVDSAPTLLVSDTQIIAKNADITLQVLRSGFTNNSILEYSRKIQQEEKFRNITFVLNAVTQKSAYGYNYGYGYGYGESKHKVTWYRRLFSKINLF
ncbi:GumC family protein [Flagellimonas marinaquae]